VTLQGLNESNFIPFKFESETVVKVAILTCTDDVYAVKVFRVDFGIKH